MSNRRDFLKTAAFAALGSGMAINHVFAGGNDAPSLFNVNSRAGVTPKMKLRFFPYELKLRHVFTVATYSRSICQSEIVGEALAHRWAVGQIGRAHV